jgi:hypothetical protein
MAAVLWTGFDELLTQLRNLPERLAGEAGTIVNDTTDRFMTTTAAAYPKRSGNLSRGLRKLQKSSGRFGVIYQVQNVAPHAGIFENGTQVRHTAIGANRGAMPPGHIFVPNAIRARAQMYQRLADMLEREGLLVTGRAA